MGGRTGNDRRANKMHKICSANTAKLLCVCSVLLAVDAAVAFEGSRTEADDFKLLQSDAHSILVGARFV